MSGAYGGPISLDWPTGRLRVQQGEGGRPVRGVATHPLNHAAEVFLPGASASAAPVAALAAAQPIAYACRALPLAFFLGGAARALLADGSLLATSVDTPVDQGSAAGLLPDGTLVLSLDKETYERLGLPGRASHFAETQRHGTARVGGPGSSRCSADLRMVASPLCGGGGGQRCASRCATRPCVPASVGSTAR